MAVRRDGQDPSGYLGVDLVVHPKTIKAQRAPLTTDRRYKIGTIWIDQSSNQSYQLTNVLAAVATWTLLGPGASDVDTLTGDSGGAISPAAGNITLAGGTNIASAGAGSTITFNLNSAITLATSVTSPLYTAGAGVNLDITAPANQDMVLKLGDAAGGTKLDITDSADVTQANIDSDGNLALQGNIAMAGAGTVLGLEGGAATDFIGQATLVAGTVTIANTNILATDRILLQRTGINASTALGHLDVSISAGASFSITSRQAASPGMTETNDTSIVNYFIVRQL